LPVKVVTQLPDAFLVINFPTPYFKFNDIFLIFKGNHNIQPLLLGNLHFFEVKPFSIDDEKRG
jgi:hypothetical protein